MPGTPFFADRPEANQARDFSGVPDERRQVAFDLWYTGTAQVNTASPQGSTVHTGGRSMLDLLETP